MFTVTRDLQLRAARKSTEGSVFSTIYRRKSKSSLAEEQVKASSATEGLVGDTAPDQGCISGDVVPHASHSHISVADEHVNTSATVANHPEITEKHTDLEEKITVIDDLNLIDDDSLGYPMKRQKNLSSDEVELQRGTHTEFGKRTSEEFERSDETSNDKSEDAIIGGADDAKCLPDEAHNKSGCQDTVRDEAEIVVEVQKLGPPSISHEGQVIPCSTEWKPIEKELYLKGVEIFGRNRYLRSCSSAVNKLMSPCVILYFHRKKSIYFPFVSSRSHDLLRFTDSFFAEAKLSTISGNICKKR